MPSIILYGAAALVRNGSSMCRFVLARALRSITWLTPCSATWQSTKPRLSSAGLTDDEDFPIGTALINLMWTRLNMMNECHPLLL